MNEPTLAKEIITKLENWENQRTTTEKINHNYTERKIAFVQGVIDKHMEPFIKDLQQSIWGVHDI